MNITFLIGNGFDKCLGLPTSYKEFYEYYIQQKSSSPEIEHIKDILKKATEEDNSNFPKIEMWKDLEIALGQITQNYNNPEIFEKVYRDINRSLRSYIEQCSKNFKGSPENKDILIKDLISPFNHLPEAQKETMTSFLHTNENWYINIISFNYTYSIEKILGVKDDSMVLGNTLWGYDVILQNIRHIHSTYDSSILLGVNDTTQIANEAFKNNLNICDFLVKPIVQKSMKGLIENKCKNEIHNSKLIVVFGMSLGPSDNQWWELIINKCLNSQTKAIIFLYDKEVSELIQHEAFLVPRHEREFLDNLVRQLNLNIDSKTMEVLQQNIFIKYQDKGIFNFDSPSSMS